MRYWIQDEDDTPQGFPLRMLLKRILEVLPPPYELRLLRSEGLRSNRERMGQGAGFSGSASR